MEKTAKFAISVANGIFGDRETKLKVAESIIDTISLSCLRYSTDPEFKAQVDARLKKLSAEDTTISSNINLVDIINKL